LQSRAAHHHHDSGEADDHAGKPPGRDLLVARPDMRDENAEQRRRCIEDGGEPGRDMALAPGDQCKRDDVVEKSHAEEGGPYAPLARHGDAHDAQHGEKRERRKADPQRHDGSRRQLAHRDADEQERAAPQHGERDEHGPLAQTHDGFDGSVVHASAPLPCPEAQEATPPPPAFCGASAAGRGRRAQKIFDDTTGMVGQRRRPTRGGVHENADAFGRGRRHPVRDDDLPAGQGGSAQLVGQVPVRTSPG